MRVNGNEYTLPNFDYNTICDLDAYGVQLLAEKMPSINVLMRGVLALKLGSLKKAGEEIQAHTAKNGLADWSAWTDEIMKALEDGGFFTAIREAAEADRKKKEKAERAAKAKAEAAKEAEKAFGADT